MDSIDIALEKVDSVYLVHTGSDAAMQRENTGYFVYTPLDDPQTQIRLLDLQPGGYDDKILCTVRTFELDNVPKFEAISYTWGDPFPLYPVEVNGRTLLVRKNCHYALSQMRRSRTSRRLWIDSICINQDDTVEKGHQVQRFARIFERANTVLVSLGPASDDSDFLLSSARSLYLVCRGASSREAHNLRSRVTVDTQESAAEVFLWPPAVRAPAYSWVAQLPDHNLGALFRALVYFSIRPYWTRLWVVPELTLASRATLHCGRKSSTLGILKYLIGTFQELRKDINFQRRTTSFDYGSLKENGIMNLPLSQMYHRVSRRMAGGALLPLSGHFIHLRDLQCSDPRDRVYALLPIGAWPDEIPPPIVSYQKSRVELAREVVKCCPSLWHLEHLLRALEIKSDDTNQEMSSFRRNRKLLDLENRHSAMSKQEGSCGCARSTQRQTRRIRMFAYCHLQLSATGALEIGDDIFPLPGVDMDPSFDLNQCPEMCRVVLDASQPNNRRKVVALVPKETVPGDIIMRESHVRTKNGYQSLVVRRNALNIYEIIGNAITRPDYQMWSGCHYHCEFGSAETSDKRRTLISNQLELRIDVSDALAFGLQIVQHQQQATRHLPAYEMLEVPFTRSRFSSYVVEWDPSAPANRGPPEICDTCGGFLEADNLSNVV